jgi:tetratricopeptide (TPR) repeat protein
LAENPKEPTEKKLETDSKVSNASSQLEQSQGGLALFFKWLLAGVALCILFGLSEQFWRAIVAFFLIFWGMAAPFFLSFALVDLSNHAYRRAWYGFAELCARLGLQIDAAVKPLMVLVGIAESPFSLFNSLNLSSCLLFKGRFQEARELLRQAMKVSLELPELELSLTPLVLSHLAGVEIMLGNFQEARMTINRASLLNENKLRQADLSELEKGSIRLALCADKHALGCLLDKANEHEKALGQFEEAFALLKELPQNFDPEGELEANFLQAIAEQEIKLGRLEFVCHKIERSLLLRQRNYGARHPLTAACYHILGEYALARGDFSQAAGCLAQAQKIRENYARFNPADLADTLVVQAQLASALANFGKAQLLLTRALSLKKQVFGESYPDVAYVLENLAQLALSQGNADAEAELREQAAQMRRKFILAST